MDQTDLIDIAYVGSQNDPQFDFEIFRLFYCNPKIQYNRQTWNISCIIQAYPIGEYRSKATAFLKKMPYNDFLKTAYWQSISTYIIDLNKGRCSACGSDKKPCVHHKTYQHRGEEIFFLEDLACLCLVCHNKFHGQ